ncbi:MAG: hypothetical protein CVV41_19000 [Candidatus Riflebacteria bacterium HGW-Riflebacteria-1]|jgi:hypothetical protein|nr:MAG: hypothetical protein CVV41_19000 [Candidatus Riflebacteria bacterium HGW-Riflebacteria-1]
MVLKLLLIAVIVFQPCLLSACDPNFQPEEIFTLLYSPPISPGIFLLAANIAFLSDMSLPESWESSTVSGSGGFLREFDVQLFRTLLPAFGFLAGKLRDNLAGRAIVQTPPMFFSASRDSLQTGAWQTLVLQFSLPVTGKIVIYRRGGKIEFIDEIDSTLNFSLTSAWPPVLFKHFRVWDRHGMIFAWPAEDADFSQGVVAAQ